jgi:hypothetical protein
LRTNLLVAALLLCVYLPVKSSAQAAQGGSPTLVETMAFLNEKLQQRGTLQYSSDNLGDYKSTATIFTERFSGTGCEQTYRYEVADYSSSRGEVEKSTGFVILKLDQADVSSVAILEPDTEQVTTAYGIEAKSRPVFAVAVNKIAYSRQIAPQLQPPKELDFHHEKLYLLTGRVMSVDATSVTWLPEHSGYPQRLTPDKSITFYMGVFDEKNKRPKAKLTDISPGDHIQAFMQNDYDFSNKSSIYIEKIPGAVAATLPDPEIILPATRQVGPERKQFMFGYSKDREDAERIAKAMIHAVVVCQGNAKKELF